jgi:hypothetical protein
MHNKTASRKYVPLMGEMITGRWAYEALMVSQFKYNRFEKQFYKYDKETRNAIFYKSYGIPELRRLIDECDNLKNDTIKMSENLSIIKNEIAKICIDLEWPQQGFVELMTASTYKSPLKILINNFVDKAEKQYIYQYNEAIDKRDGLYTSLVKKLGSDDAFIQYKQRYYNKRIADAVTNENEIKDFNIQDGEMVRVKDAIFRTPESFKGRAHFYAPVKRILKLTIGTFWFNLIIIWLFSVILFVLLYFDVLRKIIAYFESFLLSRRNRIRILRLLTVYEQPDAGKRARNIIVAKTQSPEEKIT